VEVPIVDERNTCVLRRGDTAVKILPVSPLSRQEIKIHRKMKHPNILPLIKVRTRDDGTKFELIMPYVSMTMIDLIGNVPLNEIDARRYFNQILSAVKYIHSMGFVHNDIKLENILYDEVDDICYIIDFGLSFAYKPNQYVTNSSGSYDYAAPEIWTGLPRIGIESDVWSLGVCLYAMVTARFPFKLEDNDGPLKLVRGDLPLEIPQTMSYELRQLLVFMLDRNHRTRIPIDVIESHPWVRLDTCELRSLSSQSHHEDYVNMEPFEFSISLSAPEFNSSRRPGRLKRLWRRFWRPRR